MLRNILQKRRHDFLQLTPPSMLPDLQQLASQCLPKNMSRIACYYSTSDEYPTHDLIQTAWQKGHHVYLPCLNPHKKKYLLFCPYTKETLLKPNIYEIMEPCDFEKEESPDSFDIIFVPLLGFNAAGYRMGMGQGYYDRTLHGLSDKTKPRIIGLAFSCQACVFTPHPWDIRCHQIVTERDILSFS